MSIPHMGVWGWGGRVSWAYLSLRQQRGELGCSVPCSHNSTASTILCSSSLPFISRAVPSSAPSCSHLTPSLGDLVQSLSFNSTHLQTKALSAASCPISRSIYLASTQVSTWHIIKPVLLTDQSLFTFMATSHWSFSQLIHATSNPTTNTNDFSSPHITQWPNSSHP